MVITLLHIAMSSALFAKDLDEFGLVGSVKTVTAESQSAKPGSEKEYRTWTFDEGGLLINSQSRIDMSEGASPAVMGRNITKTAVGNHIEEKELDEKDNLLGRRVSTLDAQGRTVETSEYFADGTLSTKTIIAYENTTKTVTFYSHGHLLYTRYDFMNSKGDLSESRRYKADGSLEERTKFERRGDGKVLEIRSFSGEDSSPISRMTVRYDGNRNVVEEVALDEGNIPVTKRIFEYNYDSIGNWVKREVTEWTANNGQLTKNATHITKRRIDYYLKRGN
jgi:hypothetical protein